MIEALFVLLNTAGCAVSVWYALCALNAATRQTALAVRVSFAAIAVGAFAALLHPPELDIGGIGEVLIVCGIAAGFLANRKSCICLNCPARAGRLERIDRIDRIDRIAS